jgi:2-methylisocitrate lyase-like PEP mutase family enzyme
MTAEPTSPADPTSPAGRLRALLAEPGIDVMQCCADGLSARLIADAGYRVSFMSGFAVSASRLGLPDAGLISYGEMVDSLRACVAAAPDLPIIADGDTGYGNAMNVRRTVEGYARAGAAGVMIEDQVAPKKCGHTRGKQVVARGEARSRIAAAVEAGRRAGILVMARTDARATDGLDEALRRIEDFAAEGADILFLEAPENAEEMRAFVAAAGGRPCMANMVHGGRTPVLPPAELARIGYRLAAYPVVLLSAAIAAMQEALTALQPGQAAPFPAMPSFEALQAIVGFPEYWAGEARFKAPE